VATSCSFNRLNRISLNKSYPRKLKKRPAVLGHRPKNLNKCYAQYLRPFVSEVSFDADYPAIANKVSTKLTCEKVAARSSFAPPLFGPNSTQLVCDRQIALALAHGVPPSSPTDATAERRQLQGRFTPPPRTDTQVAEDIRAPLSCRLCSCLVDPGRGTNNGGTCQGTTSSSLCTLTTTDRPAIPATAGIAPSRVFT
jgi:hypothetical protein